MVNPHGGTAPSAPTSVQETLEPNPTRQSQAEKLVNTKAPLIAATTAAIREALATLRMQVENIGALPDLQMYLGEQPGGIPAPRENKAADLTPADCPKDQGGSSGTKDQGGPACTNKDSVPEKINVGGVWFVQLNGDLHTVIQKNDPELAKKNLGDRLKVHVTAQGQRFVKVAEVGMVEVVTEMYGDTEYMELQGKLWRIADDELVLLG